MMDRELRTWTSAGRAFMAGGAVLALAACGGDGGGNLVDNNDNNGICDLDQALLITSLARNSIPALVEPRMVPIGDPETSYLFDTDRVLGVVINGEARAYPHNILWWHEIVNDRFGTQTIAVSFCPLTGSGIAFDTNLNGRQIDLGVSGLLFANNLIMFDRTSNELYGPQLSIEGRCEGFIGQSLDMIPVQEMSWGRWQELHPSTVVIAGDLNFGRNYRFYPYGTYDDLSSADLLFPMSVDNTRPIKERVLAIRSGDGGRGYPFLELLKMGDMAAINEMVTGIPTAIFYELTDGQTALAFDARVAGQTLTFDADIAAGVFTDRETSSTWTINGVAIAGPLAGEVMQTRNDAFTVFWFAWRFFQPNGDMFSAP